MSIHYHECLPPNDGGFHVLFDIVGRRHTRHGGPRVMAEDVGNKTDVHAYGIGGSGFEASWGIVGEVLRLVEKNRPKSRL